MTLAVTRETAPSHDSGGIGDRTRRTLRRRPGTSKRTKSAPKMVGVESLGQHAQSRWRTRTDFVQLHVAAGTVAITLVQGLDAEMIAPASGQCRRRIQWCGSRI